MRRPFPTYLADRYDLSSNSIWSAAISTLPDRLKSEIDFAQQRKHLPLDNLLQATVEARKRLIGKSSSFKRRSGEVVSWRDVLAKLDTWINSFKQVGDVLVPIDPLNAVPPWAGVRFLFMVRRGTVFYFNEFRLNIQAGRDWRPKHPPQHVGRNHSHGRDDMSKRTC